MTRTNMIRHMLTATRVHGLTHEHLCRRCGITLTWERATRYQDACRDCAPYLGIKRAA